MSELGLCCSNGYKIRDKKLQLDTLNIPVLDEKWLTLTKNIRDLQDLKILADRIFVDKYNWQYIYGKDKMKNKNYLIAFGSFTLFVVVVGWIFKLLWFVLVIILAWGIITFIFENLPFINISENLPFIKTLCGKIHLIKNLIKKIDDIFRSTLSRLYDFLPNKIYYCFRLRVPIISGLILFLLPLIAHYGFPDFLQNIFVMKDGRELILVMFFATFSATTIVSLLKTILVLIDDKLFHNFNNSLIRSFLTFYLFWPTWILLLYLNNDWTYRGLEIVIGIIPFAISQFYEYKIIPSACIGGDLKQRRNKIFLGGIVLGVALYILVIIRNFPTNIPLKDWQSLKDWQNSQAPTLLYLLLLIWILNLFVGIVTLIFDQSIDTQRDKQKDLLLDFTPQDKYSSEKKTNLWKKIKLYNHTFYWLVILFLLMFSSLGYGVWGVDHFFKLENSQVKIENYEQDFQQAIWNRLCEEDFDTKNKTQTCDDNKSKSLVVVAASGGGIQASGWMTQVLAGLQDRQWGIGEDFTKAIGLISSTSGGSVGSMFYFNQFKNGILSDQGLKKDENALVAVVKNATDDWLNSVGWGLAFPDLFRFIAPPVLHSFRELGGDGKRYLYLDRGYALEKNWQKTLTVEGKEPLTLDDRRKQILAGEIPIAVYNTTLVENGRPFLISPMKFVPGEMADYASESSNKLPDTALDFKTLYKNCGTNGDQPCDLALTTAARLSASFPYVTPMARNDLENIIKVNGKSFQVKDKNGKETDFLQNYHIADGGYYDNAGVFTAMNWLNSFLTYNNSAKNNDHQINIKRC